MINTLSIFKKKEKKQMKLLSIINIFCIIFIIYTCALISISTVGAAKRKITSTKDLDFAISTENLIQSLSEASGHVWASEQ